MLLITKLMRAFFALLYHPFAFTYDLVAAAVSFGHWKEWTQTVLPYLVGPRVLELGFGPGHLHRILLDLGLFAVGLDESRQMTALAKQRLPKSGYAQVRLTRGVAQNLPYPSGYFNTIVATFPSEYIFDAGTLSETKRCLINGGRLIVLPVAWPRNRLLAWLYRVTGESPKALEIISEKIRMIFTDAGFETIIENIETDTSALLLVVAEKKNC
jgi:ubiquinone/menaquinone biosynthesis C-methylase UbiE